MFNEQQGHQRQQQQQQQQQQGRHPPSSQQGSAPAQGGAGGRNMQALLQHLMSMEPQQRQQYFNQYPQLQAFVQAETQRRQRLNQFQVQPQQPQTHQQSPPQSHPQMANNQQNVRGMMPQQSQQQQIVPPVQQNMNFMNANNGQPQPMNMQMQQRMQQPPNPQQQMPMSMMSQPPPAGPVKRGSGAGRKKKVDQPSGPVIVPPSHGMNGQQQPQHLNQAQLQAQMQAAQLQRAQGMNPQQQMPKHMGIQPGARVPMQGVASQKPIPPQIPPPERIQSDSFWSNYLEKEHKPVGNNILMYEQLIQRDIKHLKAMEEDSRDKYGSDLLNRLMNEIKFYNTVRDSRFKIIQDKEAGRPAESIWGEGYQGYGNGFTDRPKTEILLPENAKRATKLPIEYVSAEDTLAQATRPEELVPIRLEFDLERDKFRLTDTFLWNLNENTISVEELVDTITDDFKFKDESHTQALIQSIKEQLNEYHPMVFPKPSLSSKIADLRIPIKLDITIGNNRLVDRFEWDIINNESDPEEFARVLCEDMSLSGEFLSAISHSIREQTQIYVKALYIVGYKFDGSLVDGDEVRRFIGPTIDPLSVVRPRYLLPDWSTSLSEINFSESERLDKEREREARRKRRGQQRVGRRSGAVLPDLSDVPKTLRTPIISSVFAGGVNIETPVDGYVDTLLSVEVPKEQIDAYSKAKEKERLAAIKKQEEALKREQEALSEESGLLQGNGRVRILSNDSRSFTISIKYN